MAEISRLTDIPASTIYNAINRDFRKMDIGHLNKIADALDVSTDYLIRDEITDPNYGKPLTPDGVFVNDKNDKAIITNFLKLSELNKTKVAGVIEHYLSEQDKQAAPQKQTDTAALTAPEQGNIPEVYEAARGGEGFSKVEDEERAKRIADVIRSGKRSKKPLP